MDAEIFEIKRFAVHDGAGIRTTVFFKGCPLKCVWCHNPEGIARGSQIAFYENKCVSCGRCASVCPKKVHHVTAGVHIFEKEDCISCGNCVKECPKEALTLYGKKITLDRLLPVLLEDYEFYQASGGGVTLSGGECLLQADFCTQLLKSLKKEGIHTAVDTCGFVEKKTITKVIPYTDIFLYDLKAYEENVHIRCTGQSNKRILENLKYIDSCGKASEIRIPFVPEYNAGEIPALAEFIAGLRNVTAVRILPYHNYAGSKYEALKIKNTLPSRLPVPQELEEAENMMRKAGIRVR